VSEDPKFVAVGVNLVTTTAFVSDGMPVMKTPDNTRNWKLVDSHCVVDANKTIRFFWFWKESR
jgi:hypothetical protein